MTTLTISGIRLYERSFSLSPLNPPYPYEKVAPLSPSLVERGRAHHRALLRGALDRHSRSVFLTGRLQTGSLPSPAIMILGLCWGVDALDITVNDPKQEILAHPTPIAAPPYYIQPARDPVGFLTTIPISIGYSSLMLRRAGRRLLVLTLPRPMAVRSVLLVGTAIT